jgi:Flagellar motor switch protein
MADDPTKTTTDFLDQNEIDRLLAQQSEAQVKKGGVLGAENTTATRKIEPYDFRNPAFLSEAELRRLRLLHEDFLRYPSARLSLYLRMEFGLKMAKLTTVTYSKFTDSLPNPTHISLFKVEPLVGVGILDINPASRSRSRIACSAAAATRSKPSAT